MEDGIATHVWSFRANFIRYQVFMLFVLLAVYFILIHIKYTDTQPNTLFPEWREFFKIPVGVSSSSLHLSQQVAVLTVRDSSFVGHQVSPQDDIIGFTLLPLSVPLLVDQHSHVVWLPLQQPRSELIVMVCSYCLSCFDYD